MWKIYPHYFKLDFFLLYLTFCIEFWTFSIYLTTMAISNYGFLIFKKAHIKQIQHHIHQTIPNTQKMLKYSFFRHWPNPTLKYFTPHTHTHTQTLLKLEKLSKCKHSQILPLTFDLFLFPRHTVHHSRFGNGLSLPEV